MADNNNNNNDNDVSSKSDSRDSDEDAPVLVEKATTTTESTQAADQMRKRKSKDVGGASSSSSSNAGSSASSSSAKSAKFAMGAAKAVLSGKPPAWLETTAKAVQPVVVQAMALFQRAEPHLVRGWDAVLEWKKKADPYHPEELVKIFAGLVLMFFGGLFVNTIAVVEAVRLCGYHQIYDALMEIFQNTKKLKVESDKDDQVDADNDGVADVKQLSKQDLISRKINLIIRNVDPEKIRNATGSLYAAFIAVTATLQSRFARVIALGTSIGEELQKPAERHLVPLLTPLFPEQYRKWVPLGVGYVCKSIGVSLAWFLQRIMAAFHSAVRGAKMCTDGLTAFSQRNGYGNLTEGYWDETMAFGLAAFGLYWQLCNAFSLPWLLYFLLYPIVLFESILSILGVY